MLPPLGLVFGHDEDDFGTHLDFWGSCKLSCGVCVLEIGTFEMLKLSRGCMCKTEPRKQRASFLELVERGNRVLVRSCSCLRPFLVRIAVSVLCV
jgi:hypothetical protein